mgnify:CR=1 FL=1
MNQYIPAITVTDPPSAAYLYGIIYSVIQVVQDALLDSASAAIMMMEKWNLKSLKSFSTTYYGPPSFFFLLHTSHAATASLCQAEIYVRTQLWEFQELISSQESKWFFQF